MSGVRGRTEGNTGPQACSIVDGCLTCGDVAVPVAVVRLLERDEALCRDEHGTVGRVAVDLVDPVVPGDRLLVHAGVAIERLPTHVEGR